MTSERSETHDLLKIYRLISADQLDSPFSGVGSDRGGRWTSEGSSGVYASLSPSTALGDLSVEQSEAILDSAREPAQGSDVQVEVQDGAVQLSGFVESVDSKTKAADIASTVAGVTDVQNNIAVQANEQR